MNEKQKVLDKVSKLLAKAQGTNNEHEAAAFLAKVHDMLEQYNITMLDLGMADDDPVGVDRDATHCWRNTGWMKPLGSMLARYYGCQQVNQWQGNKILLSWVGRESARKTVAVMLPFVVQQVRQQAKALREQHITTRMERLPGVPREEVSRSFKGLSSYERAVANALVFRIQTLLEEHEQTQQPGKGLVPVDAIQAAMQDAFPDMTQGRATSLSTTKAARQAAGRVSLHRQTGGSGQKLIGD
jgi:hypothetical protein